MGFSTPFTRAFNITVPVCLAPMAGVSGGKLAAAVARGGGLGVIAAGSGRDTAALDHEVEIFREKAPVNARLVIGIISWAALGVDGYGVTEAALHQSYSPTSGTRSAEVVTTDGSGSGRPTESGDGEEAGGTRLLKTLLDRYNPDAMWFFAPGAPSKEAYSLCQSRGIEVIAQVGTVSEARTAAEMGASVVVAQGREAGGHGLRPEIGRGTLPLAAAVVVELAETGKTVLAAGGVVSGRGLLAALALGCDGVVMGTRYCATNESLMSEDHKAKIVITSGDEALRTRVYDMAAAARPSNPVTWPEPYDSSGVAANDFTRTWHTHEEKLAEELSRRDSLTGFSVPTLQLEDAERSRNLAVGRVFLGEGAGLIYSVEDAEKLTRDIVREADEQLDNVNKLRSLGRGSSRMMSLSAESVEDLDIRDRRAYTASALPSNTVIRPPGTRQVISSGSSYEKMAGYSRAVRVGKHVQVAGTTATSPDGSGVLCVGDVEGQTQYIFHIIALALREAGCALENVVRTRMFLTDIANAEKVMAEHHKIFNAIRPAATILMVSALVHPDLLVEIEADALEP